MSIVEEELESLKPLDERSFDSPPIRLDRPTKLQLRKQSTPGSFRFFEDTDTEGETPLAAKSPSTKITIVPPQVNNGKDTCSNYSSFRSRGRGSTRRVKRRAVRKSGECNVTQVHISKRRRRYLQDIFTTLVDVKWRWTLLVFALSFTLSWLMFAAIWWLIAYTHGDLDPANLEDEKWLPCVVNINNFASCFLFSIETQHTIGYGSRSTTEECPEAIFVMCLQSITGVFIQAFMVGIVFAKMARPKQRSQTLMFSKFAVVCMRDGMLCLMFRVGDMRKKSHLISSSVRAQLVRPYTTKEGEVLTPFLHDLKVKADNYESDIFLIWPTTVIHEIDSASPLYDLSAADMINERFEIVVILEGTTESTGQTTQARTSYVAGEILWGHRFTPMVTFNKSKESYSFDKTYQVDTPLCSARNLEAFLETADMDM
ncbi:G protein-activated inward rectifier potassium channel 3-like isoform X2 [Rhodnius prolixus]|uniref:G protein-activated inward rectifier potassium channel 3-like isoform X2 n=1 Tax=Rhodnius prolixus TaxID=13249 RepID=UPI003D187DC3